MIWLLIFAAAVAAFCVCVVLEHLLFERRQPPPAVLHVKPTVPPQLPTAARWGHADLIHTRLPGPPGPGRHRRDGGTA